MSKLKIGFLGAGYIGGVHASILARDDRVKVAAIYDVSRARAEQLAGSGGAKVAHRLQLRKCWKNSPQITQITQIRKHKGGSSLIVTFVRGGLCIAFPICVICVICG
jgi:hypothetical protein